MSNPNVDGIKRAKFLLNNGAITYQSMKRIKHDLERLPKNDVKYSLAGGELMQSFVNRMLSNDRAAVSMEKKLKQPAMPDVNKEMHLGTPYSLNEVKKTKIENAICIIVNNDNKFLLLKRAEIENSWGSNQWGLVGGGIEKKDKSPEEACRREVQEETGLVLGKFIKRFVIERNGETEHIFVTKYDGDGTNIELNEENTNYGWFNMDEFNHLNTVPQLKEYLVLAFKPYND
jgi:8-oxo-dGTP diphosphatase